MNKWIAASTCVAAVLSLAVASAQTYPQTSGTEPTTKSTPARQSGQTTTRSHTPPSSSRSSNAAQPMTLTGCIMPGSGIAQSPSATASAGAANVGAWILSNASASSNSASSETATSAGARAQASRSGSPSNEGAIGTNRNGATGAGVSGSTSSAVGTSGANTPGNIDTEAHGAGVAGATDQRGSTVGAGVTANGAASQNSARSAAAQESASGSYQLSGITNPNEFSGKRVEVTGTVVPARTIARARRSSTSASGTGTPMLRVTEVRVLSDSCQ